MSAVRAGLALNRSHLPQRQEKQNGGERVEENVREMVTACFEIKQLAIVHVRNDRERMPVPCSRVD